MYWRANETGITDEQASLARAEKRNELFAVR
jgi:hypothetical protein